MPIGVIANCISVPAGGVIGSAQGHVLPNSLKEHLPTLFCCSGFGWYSTLTEGIVGNLNLLFAKSVLDFFTAMIFASTLGQTHKAIFSPESYQNLLSSNLREIMQHVAEEQAASMVA